MKAYKAIGVMSGTSIDGIDIACVEFWKSNGKWNFRLGPWKSIPYSAEWENRLHFLPDSSALDFVKTHVEYGRLNGEMVHQFILENNLEVDVVGFHGHTIFHNPALGYTSQIGDGAAMAAVCAQLVACDFRSMDVARGGQGAPLVPIGDDLLFSEYTACVNVGGFANISYKNADDLVAFDICPANIVLNKLANELQLPYDAEGKIAESGSLNQQLLEQLNSLDYYLQSHPKSLGKEWVDQFVEPILLQRDSAENLLRTFVEHVAIQISGTLNTLPAYGQALFSGGGVFNSFLMKRISDLTIQKIHTPERDIIEMKEAIVFAFLGVLRMLNETNIYSKVTGATDNSISGALYQGKIHKS
jgi:anhydro-N-acetylmuramic acid kinase